MDVAWKWTLAGLAILVATLALWPLLRSGNSNIDRSRFGHWFRTLIRLYDEDARIEIVQRRGPVRLTLLRRGGAGSRCWVVLSCPLAGCTDEQAEAIRFAVSGHPAVLVLSGISQARRQPTSLDIQVDVKDIWSPASADVIVWVVEHVLGLLGVGAQARFDFDFAGEHSMRRAREVRQRQKDGSLEKW